MVEVVDISYFLDQCFNLQGLVEIRHLPFLPRCNANFLVAMNLLYTAIA